MQFADMASEEVIGGVVALLATIYGVHKKFKSDKVESTNQKAEINIIESLIKHRDDSVTFADKYREALRLAETELHDLKIVTNSLELEKLKLIEKLDDLDSEVEVLKSIISFLTDTLSVARQKIENNASTENR